MPTLRHLLLYWVLCCTHRFRWTQRAGHEHHYQYQYQCLISISISPDPFMYSTHQVLH